MLVASLSGQRSARDGPRSTKAKHRRNNDRVQQLLRRSQSPSRTKRILDGHEESMDPGSRSLSPTKASNAIPQEGPRQSPHQSTGKSQLKEATPHASLQRQGSPQLGLQAHNACESIRPTTNKPPNPDAEHSDVESYSYCSSSRSWSPSPLSHTPRTPGWPASFPASPHDCVLEKLGPALQDRRTATDGLNDTPARSPRKSWFSSDRSVISRLTACCFLACVQAHDVRKRFPPPASIFPRSR